MIKKILTISVFLSLSFGIGFYSYFYLQKNKGPITTELKYIADFSDNKKVSGFAENIFIGKIIKNDSKYKIGKERFEFTNFKVEIIKNIKGNFKGIINMKQEYGYDKYGNPIIIKGTYLPKEGKYYIFATSGENPTYLLSHPNGIHEVKNDQKSKNLINKWRDAYKNEVYYEGSKKISSMKNSYINLSNTEKEKLKHFDNFEISETVKTGKTLQDYETEKIIERIDSNTFMPIYISAVGYIKSSDIKLFIDKIPELKELAKRGITDKSISEKIDAQLEKKDKTTKKYLKDFIIYLQSLDNKKVVK